jgi:hypothetical protein
VTGREKPARDDRAGIAERTSYHVSLHHAPGFPDRGYGEELTGVNASRTPQLIEE